MAPTLFVSWAGASDTSLVRSDQGKFTVPARDVPGEGVCLSIFERGALTGEGESRTPDIRSTGVDSDGRGSGGEEGGELHGG